MSMSRTLSFSPNAVARIQEMGAQVSRTRDNIGMDYAAPMADSLAHCLVTMIGLGGNVAASEEGNIRLNGVTDTGFEYGVVWFPKYRKCEDAPEELHYAFGWKMPGTWSIHS